MQKLSKEFQGETFQIDITYFVEEGDVKRESKLVFQSDFVRQLLTQFSSSGSRVC